MPEANGLVTMFKPLICGSLDSGLIRLRFPQKLMQPLRFRVCCMLTETFVTANVYIFSLTIQKRKIFLIIFFKPGYAKEGSLGAGGRFRREGAAFSAPGGLPVLPHAGDASQATKRSQGAVRACRRAR